LGLAEKSMVVGGMLVLNNAPESIGDDEVNAIGY